MIRQDDRTDDQRRTHRWAVVARDRYMSGWGGAAGGASRCAWAVPDGEDWLQYVEKWVRARSEMQWVSVVNLETYRPPRSTAHFHIYVVTATHPALPVGVRSA